MYLPIELSGPFVPAMVVSIRHIPCFPSLDDEIVLCHKNYSFGKARWWSCSSRFEGKHDVVAASC